MTYSERERELTFTFANYLTKILQFRKSGPCTTSLHVTRVNVQAYHVQRLVLWRTLVRLIGSGCMI